MKTQVPICCTKVDNNHYQKNARFRCKPALIPCKNVENRKQQRNTGMEENGTAEYHQKKFDPTVEQHEVSYRCCLAFMISNDQREKLAYD